MENLYLPSSLREEEAKNSFGRIKGVPELSGYAVKEIQIEEEFGIEPIQLSSYRR
jgi:hypothetical protein